MNIDALRSYIKDDILSDPTMVIEDDQDLLLSETLDSLSVMRLVAEIETRTGAPVPAGDITLENFQTLTAIAAYVASRG